jgi:hypothetical protein
MIWSVPNMWEDGEVWILGGGPSMTKQFGIPDNVVQDVKQGIAPPSVYSPYLSAIHNKHVIGINVSYLIGDWIDMVFFGDSQFYQINRDKLAIFPGLKVSCHPMMTNHPWVKYLATDTKRSKGISFNPAKVSWNCNSGAAAISVAVNSGAKKIILVGFDMNTGEDKSRHWHNLYAKTETRKNLGKNGRAIPIPFARHLEGFPAIARDAASKGIEIINASPTSSITVLKKCSVQELLEVNVTA